MAGHRSLPFHVGGPLGLAGLTMLAGAAGLVVVAGDDRERPAVGTEDTRPATEPGQAALGTSRPDVGEPLPTQPTARPDSDPDAPYDPIARPAAEPADPVTLPTSVTGAEVTFIVRIKGHKEVDTISRNYKRDRETAEKAYAELSKRLPGLKEFRLVGASYSGELKLAYRLAPGVEPTHGAINEVKDKIMAIEGVAYADPDYVAHPGED